MFVENQKTLIKNQIYSKHSEPFIHAKQQLSPFSHGPLILPSNKELESKLLSFWLVQKRAFTLQTEANYNYELARNSEETLGEKQIDFFSARQSLAVCHCFVT